MAIVFKSKLLKFVLLDKILILFYYQNVKYFKQNGREPMLNYIKVALMSMICVVPTTLVAQDRDMTPKPATPSLQLAPFIPDMSDRAQSFVHEASGYCNVNGCFGNICYTPNFWCLQYNYTYIGTSCTCPTSWGSVWGTTGN